MRCGVHFGSLLSYRVSVPAVTAATTGERWKCHPKSPPGITFTWTKTTLPGFDVLMLRGCAIFAAARPCAVIGAFAEAEATPAATSAAATGTTTFSFLMTPSLSIGRSHGRRAAFARRLPRLNRWKRPVSTVILVRMPDTRIELLGGFSAVVDGRPVPDGAWRLK